jgi:RNA polymerase sigma-70 factor (ECF subfamily)
VQSLTGTPDRELVDRLLQGEEQAFRLLHRRHTPRLTRLARTFTSDHGIDSDELVQDTWVRAVDRLSSFQWRASLITWLTGILVNLFREALRARGGVQFVELSEEMVAWPAPPEVTDRMELERAIAALAPGHRTILVLHDIEGFTHDEIAELLGIAVGTSKSQLCRARRAVVHTLNHERKNGRYVRT